MYVRGNMAVQHCRLAQLAWHIEAGSGCGFGSICEIKFVIHCSVKESCHICLTATVLDAPLLVAWQKAAAVTYIPAKKNQASTYFSSACEVDCRYFMISLA